VTIWTFLTGFLLGWIVGVSMSYRKIRRGRPSYRELLEIVRAQKELRERIDKRDENVIDFPGNGERKH
jgi:hypothetical protein